MNFLFRADTLLFFITSMAAYYGFTKTQSGLFLFLQLTTGLIGIILFLGDVLIKWKNK